MAEPVDFEEIREAGLDNAVALKSTTAIAPVYTTVCHTCQYSVCAVLHGYFYEKSQT